MLKIVLPIIFWSIFAYVVLRVDYPDNITSATFFQLSIFLITLFFALIFTINLFLNLTFSISITLGMVILLILKSLDSLNFVSAILTIIALWLMCGSLAPIKSGLTSKLKIPKLRSKHWRKRV